MTFEEYRDAFIDRLYDMLKLADAPKGLAKYISKIDFKWEYKNALEDISKGRFSNLQASISSRVYCYYKWFPDME